MKEQQTYTLKLTDKDVELILGALGLTYHINSRPDKTEVTRKNAYEYSDLYMNVYRQMTEQMDED